MIEVLRSSQYFKSPCDIVPFAVPFAVPFVVPFVVVPFVVVPFVVVPFVVVPFVVPFVPFDTVLECPVIFLSRQSTN